MKTTKAKSQKKATKKDAVKQLEQSLTAQFLQVITSLGHDASEIGTEVGKASKRVAKKLTKKFKVIKSDVGTKIDDLLQVSKEKVKEVKQPVSKAVVKAEKVVKKAVSKANPVVQSIKVEAIASEEKVVEAIKPKAAAVKKAVKSVTNGAEKAIEKGKETVTSAVKTNTNKPLTDPQKLDKKTVKK